MTTVAGLIPGGRRCASSGLVLVALALALTVPGEAATPPGPAGLSVDSLTREFICQCGCTLLLSACQGIMACTVADELKAEISSMLRRGMGREAVLAAFVARFGERVLSAPTRRGFNLVAWVTPFAAGLGGAVVIVLLLLAWTGARRRKPPPAPKPVEPAARDAYLERLERELRKFEW